MVHVKIKTHPLILLVRKPLKSYKRMNRTHCLGGKREGEMWKLYVLISEEARVVNQEAT